MVSEQLKRNKKGDGVNPGLSPAYDIVTASVYIDDARQFALNLGKTKNWDEASYANFEYWAEHSKIPWRAIKPHLDDTIEKARCLWPDGIKVLPKNEAHKIKIKEHWSKLQADFKIG
jgi:serine/threonine-protein kinase HipA